MKRRLRLLGNEFRDARHRRDLTLAEVCKRIGITVATLQKYEMGDIEPPALRLIDLTHTLKIDLERLGAKIARAA